MPHSTESLATNRRPRTFWPKMRQQAKQIDEAFKFIHARWPKRPRAGIVLGSGLNNFVDRIEIETEINYAEIPHLVKSTAIGHEGKLVCGNVGRIPIIAMKGRVHLYEGYSPAEVALPIRVMKRAGAEFLILSNACGGLNPNFQQGDVMVVEDQINLMFCNPLTGINDDALGPRFPDMCTPFDVELMSHAIRVGREQGFNVQKGVYAAVLGPNYETRAEIRMLRRLGADVVGMSTVPEVLVGVHSGMRILTLSVVTNVCSPDQFVQTSGEAVVASAVATGNKMQEIICGVIAAIDTH